MRGINYRLLVTVMALCSLLVACPGTNETPQTFELLLLNATSNFEINHLGFNLGTAGAGIDIGGNLPPLTGRRVVVSSTISEITHADRVTVRVDTPGVSNSNQTAQLGISADIAAGDQVGIIVCPHDTGIEVHFVPMESSS